MSNSTQPQAYDIVAERAEEAAQLCRELAEHFETVFSMADVAEKDAQEYRDCAKEEFDSLDCARLNEHLRKLRKIRRQELG